MDEGNAVKARRVYNPPRPPDIGSMTFFRGQDGPRMTWEVVKVERLDGDDFGIHLGKRLA